MKRIAPLICVATALTGLLLLAGPAVAQQERDVIEVIKTQLTTQRQALVAENLGLTAAESEVFWPIYREFQRMREPLVDRRINLLREFRDNFDGLSEDQAGSLIDKWVSIEDDIVKLRKRYIKKFRRALSERTTLRYFQIENKLDAIIQYDLTQVMPLAQ